jgi:two-component system osmolarity sensor histidine kinase EnvZ
MAPRTLFGRIVLVIAMVSIAFQAFAIMVVTQFALVPLGRQATDDFGALMVDAARAWQAADRTERPPLQERLLRVHRLRVQEPAGETDDFVHVLPYWHLLEAALTARSGQPIALRYSEAADGQTWYWADLPAGPATVRVGFAADRVAVQPSLALLLVLGVGAVVTALTAAVVARWLIKPLARLATATQPIGQGRRPAPLPESGPAELAVLAREFNRMGAQVEELLANRTTLLAGISHDLRSPLARMRLALGMMSERPDPDLLQRMLHDVDAMNELIARCLDVGRDFSERESVDLDLCELLREVAAEYDHAAVEIRCHRGPECRMRARPLALKRILSNLVDNATRYGGGRPVDVEYAIADGQVDICVLDRGCGLPESEREAVFRPFHRLEASRSSRTGGSGLGLAIVRQIATSNGWTVELRPRPGGGTAACVRLPLEEGAQALEVPSSLPGRIST